MRRLFRLPGRSATSPATSTARCIPPRHARAGADGRRVRRRRRRGRRGPVLRRSRDASRPNAAHRRPPDVRDQRQESDDDRSDPRPPLRPSLAPQEPRLHPRLAAHPGARHRRQHRDLQHDPRRAAAAAALPSTGSAWSSSASRPPSAACPTPVLAPELADYRQRSRAMESLVEYHSMPFILLGQGEPRRVQTGVVSANFFDVLGVTPAARPRLPPRRGPAERRAGAGAELRVLDEPPGRRSGDRRQHLRDERPDPHRDRRAPAGAAVSGGERRLHAVLLLSLPHGPVHPEQPHGQDAHTLRPDGAGADGRRRNTEFEGIAGTLRSEYPAAYPSGQGFTISATSLQESCAAAARPDPAPPDRHRRLRPPHRLRQHGEPHPRPAHPSLARDGPARRPRRRPGAALSGSCSPRAACSRWPAVSLGLALAAATMRLLTAFAARFTPRASEISLDGEVLAFTLVVCVLTGLAFAVLPALPARANLVAALQGGRRGGERRRRPRGPAPPWSWRRSPCPWCCWSGPGSCSGASRAAVGEPRLRQPAGAHHDDGPQLVAIHQQRADPRLPRPAERAAHRPAGRGLHGLAPSPSHWTGIAGSTSAF